MTEQEAIAGLQILVAIASADGKLADTERAALGRMVDEFKPAGAPSVDALLARPVDFDAACAAVRSADAQRAIFGAAVAMSMVDGGQSPEERRLIDRLRAAFELSDAPQDTFNKVLGQTGLLKRPHTEPIADPELRRRAVRDQIRLRALVAGVMGMIPSPGVDGALIATQQIEMFQKISLYWGTRLTFKQFLTVGLGAMALDTAMIFGASLLKLVPVWGSLVGAGVGYASTYTLGLVFAEYLERGGEMTRAEVREAMARARQEARASFQADKVRITAARETSGPTLESLTREFQEGKLSIEEFERQIEALERGGR